MARERECGHCAAVLMPGEIEEGSGYCQNCAPEFAIMQGLKNENERLRSRCAALEAEVSRLRALCGYQDEYIDLLVKSEKRMLGIYYVHGGSAPQEDIDRGAELRRLIAAERKEGQ
jgi:hypothetical protein